MAARWKGLAALVVLGSAAAAAVVFWPFGRGAKELRLPGVVEIQEVRLGSKVGGRVAEVLVREGDLVKKDDVLVRLEAPELAAQRDTLKARVDDAKARLARAYAGPREEEKRAPAAAVEVARKHLALLDAGSRPEELRQARSRFDATMVDLRHAADDFERARQTYLERATAADDFERARSALDRSRARHTEAKAALELVEAGTRPEALEEARAELRRAEAAYDLARAPTRDEDVESARAQVAEAEGRLREVEAHLAESVVRAPEAALVEVVAVRRGDVAAPNQPLLRVLRADDMWVKVYVTETDLGKVRVGQAVEVACDAFPGRRFKGEVTLINNEAEFTPRNVQTLDERKHQVFGVRVRIADPQGVFKSGMFAEVVLPLE